MLCITLVLDAQWMGRAQKREKLAQQNIHSHSPIVSFFSSSTKRNILWKPRLLFTSNDGWVWGRFPLFCLRQHFRSPSSDKASSSLSLLHEIRLLNCETLTSRRRKVFFSLFLMYRIVSDWTPKTMLEK